VRLDSTRGKAGEKTWVKIEPPGLDFVYATINRSWMRSKGVLGCCGWSVAGGGDACLATTSGMVRMVLTLYLSLPRLSSHLTPLCNPPDLPLLLLEAWGAGWAGDLPLAFGCGRRRRGEREDLARLIVFRTYGVYKSASFRQAL
jgi:hypothetical protein